MDEANDRRRAIAALYDKHLEGLDVVTPSQVSGTRAVHHLYVIRTRRRDELFDFLRTNGVPVGVHYKKPVHQQSAYLNSVLLGPRRCENTEKLCKEIISLPIGPYMTDGDVDNVIENIREFCGRK
jgi:dTDP-4-amino-4,6-dideoxygalactose transaminase